MGATTFHTESGLDDVAAAFAEVRESAFYAHGHSGYTGTVAEKDGYRVFDLPEGKTVADAIRACDEEAWEDRVPEWLPRGLFTCYDDKSGPAVAVREDGSWHFFGFASC